MWTYTSTIKCEAKQDWAFEMENWKWISKKDVFDKWWGIGYIIKYTTKINSKTDKEIVDKIIDIKKWISIFDDYKLDLDLGYFKNWNFMKDNFIWKWYPKKFVEKISNEWKWMNYTQLRKYFDYINNIKRKLDIDNNSYIKQDLIELSTLLEYDSWKKDTNIPQTFKTLLELNIEKVLNSNELNKDFNWFYNHFKAIIAYGRNILKKQ